MQGISHVFPHFLISHSHVHLWLPFYHRTLFNSINWVFDKALGKRKYTGTHRHIQNVMTATFNLSISDQENKLKAGAKNSRLVAALAQSSPDHPAPKTLQRLTRLPEKWQTGTCMCMQKPLVYRHTPSMKPTADQEVLDILFGLTLLCTSQGLVMAERSQAVIIMALKTKHTMPEGPTCVTLCPLLQRGYTHMTISFLVVSSDIKSTHFFSSSYVCERSTIFWNMVLFLQKGIYFEVRQCLVKKSKAYEWLHWLEIKCQVSGNDGDVHEVDYMVHLPPVKVLVDVQRLVETERE